MTEQFFDEFVTFAEKQGVKKDTAAIAVSGKLIRSSMKALIARNLWDSDAFFEIANEMNPNIRKAIEVMQNSTFEKMKIAFK